MLPFADHVICLDGTGGIAACGTPSEVQAQLLRHISKLSLLSEGLRGDGGVSGSNNSEGQQSKLIGFFRLLTQLDLTKGRVVTNKLADIKSLSLTSTNSTADLDISATMSGINDTSIVTPAVDLRTSNNILVDDTSATDLNPTFTPTSSPSSAASEAAADAPIVLLVDKEGKAAGGVGWEVYWFYIKSCGGILAGVVLLVSTISVSVSAFFNNLALG